MNAPIPLEVAERRAKANGVEGQPRELHAQLWAELKSRPRREYLVKGLLTSGAYSVVYGEPGCGKSALALWLAVCIAQGQDWCGRKVRQGAVLYVAAEGGDSIAERLEAFRVHNAFDTKDVPLALLSTPVDLYKNDADANAIIAEIERIAQASGGFVLIVIDTLSRACPGGKEDTQDMGAFVAICDRMRAATGAHLLVVHHAGKDASKGARGSSALKAAADTEIEVIKDKETGVITAAVTKQRDGAGGDKYSFRLEPVEIGQDDEGEPVRSVVAIETDARTPTAKPVKGRNKLALEALANCIVMQGTPAIASNYIPAGVRVVKIDQWRDHMHSTGVLNKDDANPRSDFKRMREGLIAAKAIGIWQGSVWLAV